MKLLDIVTAPWMIIPDKLLEIQGIYLTHLRGEKINLKALEEDLGKPLDNKKERYQVIEGVAILNLDGVIAKRMNLLTDVSGGVSTQLLERDFIDALNRTDVESILLYVDSPGGTVDGTRELAYRIYDARGTKPIVAYTDGMIASAAYYIAAAADAIYISGDTTNVGSIGVVARHVDVSKAEEQIGIKTTEIYSGKYKRIASEYAPLSEEGRAYIQDQVDYIYNVFINDIARFRGLEITINEEGGIPWADGKIFIGHQALTAGLVDGVSTMDRLVNSVLPVLQREAAEAAWLKKLNMEVRENGLKGI